MNDVAAIVAAAGSGVRLGGSVPKALRELGEVPLVVRAVSTLSAAGVAEIIVVAPLEQVSTMAALLPLATVVSGGATRQESVRCGLAALSANAEVVLVHDAARALTPVSLIERVVSAVRSGHDAVVPGLAVTDTIKSVGPDGTVTATIDRTSLRAIQTPQGFTRAVVEQAYASATDDRTDDAGLIEALGKPVHVVDGDRLAMKVTTPEDLVIATALLEESS